MQHSCRLSNYLRRGIFACKLQLLDVPDNLAHALHWLCIGLPANQFTDHVRNEAIMKSTRQTALLATARVEEGHANAGNGGVGGNEADAEAAARFVIAEYLRDLGHRDPELIARQSREIVELALGEFSPGEPAHETLLCDAAIRIAVARLEALLQSLAVQTQANGGHENVEGLVAANLPELFDRYPDALGPRPPSANGLGAMHRVVPEAAPRSMNPQSLTLLPRVLRSLRALFTSHT